MKTQSTFRKLSLGLIGLAAGISMNAMADSYGETVVSTSAEGVRVATVSLADLDLGSVQGMNLLTNRITTAARMVCGPGDFRRAGSLGQARHNRVCADNAISDAMSQVHASAVAVVAVSAR